MLGEHLFELHALFFEYVELRVRQDPMEWKGLAVVFLPIVVAEEECHAVY
jgi:hypothetical protein